MNLRNGWAVIWTSVNGLWYIMAILGVSLMFWDDWSVVWRQLNLRVRYRSAKRNKKEESQMMDHLRMVLKASLKHPVSAEAFCLCTVILYFSVFVISFRTFGALTTSCLATMSAIMPYCILRLRLELQRKKGSMEGEKVTSELLRQYRIAGDNIYEALERTVPQLEDCRVCQKQLFRLLMILRNTGSVAEMRDACDVFSYSIGTNWSYMMANCIRLSAEKGVSVAMGFEDILVQMRQAMANMEERKRMNSESARITIFMVPILYLGTIGLSLYYLEMSPSQFLDNQIGTPEGVLLLLGNVFLFCVNLAILEVVNNQKLDF